MRTGHARPAFAAVPIRPLRVVRRRRLSAVAGPDGALMLRDASAGDAPAIHALLLDHLAEGHLLPREAGEVTSHAHRFVVVECGSRIVACAELAPLSRTTAEIRSFVVSHEVRRRGAGRRIVDALLERARTAGFQRVCALTHSPGYFVRRGFSMVPHTWIPEKIAADCGGCRLFRSCGQYAVMHTLSRPNLGCVPLAALHG